MSDCKHPLCYLWQNKDSANLSLKGLDLDQSIWDEVNISHGYKIHNQNIKLRPDTVISHIYTPWKPLSFFQLKLFSDIEYPQLHLDVKKYNPVELHF